jgi:hypothetical protein
MQSVVPLRGIAAAGFATDPRAERAYEWLLGVLIGGALELAGGPPPQ